MISIILGIIFIAFTVFSVLPMCPLAWGPEVIAFLKGSIPVFAAFIVSLITESSRMNV